MNIKNIISLILKCQDCDFDFGLHSNAGFLILRWFYGQKNEKSDFLFFEKNILMSQDLFQQEEKHERVQQHPIEKEITSHILIMRCLLLFLVLCLIQEMDLSRFWEESSLECIRWIIFIIKSIKNLRESSEM